MSSTTRPPRTGSPKPRAAAAGPPAPAILCSCWVLVAAASQASAMARMYMPFACVKMVTKRWFLVSSQSCTAFLPRDCLLLLLPAACCPVLICTASCNCNLRDPGLRRDALGTWTAFLLGSAALMS